MADDVNPDDLEIADELIAERRSALPGQLPDDMPKWQAATISFIDSFSAWVGKIVSWLLIPLCLAMVTEVMLRKFGSDPVIYVDLIKNGFLHTANWFASWVPSVSNPLEIVPAEVNPDPTQWAYDVSRMLYGAMFMLGAAYALSVGVHIRADFIYRNWPERMQASVDLLLYLLLYFPGMIMLLWFSSEFAMTAWTRGEKAMDTAWMPHLGPIKTVIPVSVVFLLMQGVSEVLKCWYAVRNGRWPV